MIDWPDNAEAIIEDLREHDYSWGAIAGHFGVSLGTLRKFAQSHGLMEKTRYTRRFTPEEDAEIRRRYVENDNIELIAKSLNRSVGVLRQRIYHHHPDLLNLRVARTSRVINKIGKENLAHFDPNYHEAVDKYMQSQIQAKADARAAAIAAKAARKNFMLHIAQQDINNGKKRNDAIFELRASGMDLQTIGSYFGITRERTRQIFDKIALQRAMAVSTNGSKLVHTVDQGAPDANVGTDTGPDITGEATFKNGN